MPVESIKIFPVSVRVANYGEYQAIAPGGGYGGAWFADLAQTSVSQNRLITAVNIKTWDKI